VKTETLSIGYYTMSISLSISQYQVLAANIPLLSVITLLQLYNRSETDNNTERTKEIMVDRTGHDFYDHITENTFPTV
jgi:hypothetical protein